MKLQQWQWVETVVSNGLHLNPYKDKLLRIQICVGIYLMFQQLLHGHWAFMCQSYPSYIIHNYPSKDNFKISSIFF